MRSFAPLPPGTRADFFLADDSLRGSRSPVEEGILGRLKKVSPTAWAREELLLDRLQSKAESKGLFPHEEAWRLRQMLRDASAAVNTFELFEQQRVRSEAWEGTGASIAENTDFKFEAVVLTRTAWEAHLRSTSAELCAESSVSTELEERRQQPFSTTDQEKAGRPEVCRRDSTRPNGLTLPQQLQLSIQVSASLSTRRSSVGLCERGEVARPAKFGGDCRLSGFCNFLRESLPRPKTCLAVGRELRLCAAFKADGRLERGGLPRTSPSRTSHSSCELPRTAKDGCVVTAAQHVGPSLRTAACMHPS